MLVVMSLGMQPGASLPTKEGKKPTEFTMWTQKSH